MCQCVQCPECSLLCSVSGCDRQVTSGVPCGHCLGCMGHQRWRWAAGSGVCHPARAREPRTSESRLDIRFDSRDKMSWDVEGGSPGLRDSLGLSGDSWHELRVDLRLRTAAELAGVEGGGLHIQALLLSTWPWPCGFL